MNEEARRNALPPVIRVFLSSTFSDMERERSYFNERLSPEISRLCAKRGVSFFSIDLRWGITVEDQINGQVLPICLNEIDKCRPFFIGILGDRYGSVMERVPEQIGSSIPWLDGKEGKSITELEMLYAVLDEEQDTAGCNCAFFMRSHELSAKWYGESEQSPALDKLKQLIRDDEEIPCFDYDSLEEFGKEVLETFTKWLDKEFPVPEKVKEVRRHWYNTEILRNHVRQEALSDFLSAYIEKTTCPLLFYGEGPLGKTAFLTEWTPDKGHKIIINCASDESFLYWPSIAMEISAQLNKIDSSVGYPKFKALNAMMFDFLLKASALNKDKEKDSGSGRFQTDRFFTSDEDREDFRVNFVKWLSEISIEEQVCIVINDLNLLQDSSTQFLSWLPAKVNSSINLICSTNDMDTVSYAKVLGWNTKEMSQFDKGYAREFLLSYLSVFGKSLTEGQLNKIIDSKIASYPGYLKLIADFLIECGRFNNLDTLIGDITSLEDVDKIYGYIYEYSIKELSESEASCVKNVFALLCYTEMSLKEEECFKLSSSLCPVTALEWSHIRGIFERFSLITGDYWNMLSRELTGFTKSILSEDEISTVNTVLANHMLTLLHEGDLSTRDSSVIREMTAYSRSALTNLMQSNSPSALLSALGDSAVIHYLTRLEGKTMRASWAWLFLNTDIDVPSELMGLVKRFIADSDNLTASNIAQIFVDLDLTGYIDELKALLPNTSIVGNFHSNYNAISNAYKQLYVKLLELKMNLKYHELYANVNAIFEKIKDRLSPHELCLTYYLKADCESNLSLDERLLDTSTKYFEQAIRIADTYEILCALTLRSHALYRMGNYSKALDNYLKLQRLNLEQGAVRPYLSALSSSARCYARMSKLELSLETNKRACECWRRIGNMREYVAILINISSSYVQHNMPQEGYDVLAQALGELDSVEPAEAKSLEASIISNMGHCLSLLDRFDEAERLLYEAIEKAEAIGQEGTLITSYNSLAKLYESKNFFSKSVEIREKHMELLFSRGEYQRVVHILDDAMTILHTNNYGSYAQLLYDRWESRFAEIENGQEIFRKALRKGSADQRELDNLNNQLILAKAEGDYIKIAQVYRRIAHAQARENWREIAQNLFEAYLWYKKAGADKDADFCFSSSVDHLFDKGRVLDKEMLVQLIDANEDNDIRRIIDIWQGIGSGDTDNIAEEFSEVASYDGKTELANMCIADLARVASESMTAEEIISLIDSFSGENREFLSRCFISAFLKTSPQDISDLTFKYTGLKADMLLAYYEKALVILEHFDSNDVATIAGNIAIIFRRRKDKEKTLKYHGISKDAYIKQKRPRDYLIEVMNLATAYGEFNDNDTKIKILKEGLEECDKYGEELMKASIAGNLASALILKQDESLHEEIMSLFQIEEALFRRINASKDLIISLVHQVAYDTQRGTITDETLKKLQEAKRLTEENGFNEYKASIKGLEDMVNDMTSPDYEANNAIRNLLKGLLSRQEDYTVSELSLSEDELYVANLKLSSKKSMLFREAGSIMVDKETLSAIAVHFIASPVMKGKETSLESLLQYIEWWNGLDKSYKLGFDEENGYIQAMCFIDGGDLDTASSEFYKLTKLWEYDKMTVSMFYLGISEAESFKTKKLELIEHL
ncbi:MAG: DUF4062 domain-containing protein [Clostridia bacterium]|nr:DUF4062 domain-containing protein [Clostridia bacterium]